LRCAAHAVLVQQQRRNLVFRIDWAAGTIPCFAAYCKRNPSVLITQN
jgi:hypothetical protein